MPAKEKRRILSPEEIRARDILMKKYNLDKISTEIINKNYRNEYDKIILDLKTRSVIENMKQSAAQAEREQAEREQRATKKKEEKMLKRLREEPLRIPKKPSAFEIEQERIAEKQEKERLKALEKIEKSKRESEHAAAIYAAAREKEAREQEEQEAVSKLQKIVRERKAKKQPIFMSSQLLSSASKTLSKIAQANYPDMPVDQIKGVVEYYKNLINTHGDYITELQSHMPLNQIFTPDVTKETIEQQARDVGYLITPQKKEEETAIAGPSRDTREGQLIQKMELITSSDVNFENNFNKYIERNSDNDKMLKSIETILTEKYMKGKINDEKFKELNEKLQTKKMKKSDLPRKIIYSSFKNMNKIPQLLIKVN